MNKKDECCPEFKLGKWDEKTLSWRDRHFIKETIPTLFHIPFPPMIGRKISKMWAAAEGAQKTSPDKEDTLILFADPTPFRSEIYVSVTGRVPGEHNTTISGTFVSKVFDGPYNDVPKYIKQMDDYLSTKDRKAKNYYVHYAYCPGCAKKFGHNHMILFAEV